MAPGSGARAAGPRRLPRRPKSPRGPPAARLPGAPGPAGRPAADRPAAGRLDARCWPGSCRGSPRPWSGTGSACAGSRSGATGSTAACRVRGALVRRHGARDHRGRRSPHRASSGRRWRPSFPPGFGIDCFSCWRSTPSASSRWRPRSFRSPGDRAVWQGGVDLLHRPPAGETVLRARRAPSAAWKPVARHRPEFRRSGPWPPAGSPCRGPGGVFRGARKAFPAALPPVRPARAGGGDGRGAGRPAAALHLAPQVRRRVTGVLSLRAAGPERIEPEWWAGVLPVLATGGHRGDGAVRDYYRIEDADGRRYWLYRAGLYGDAAWYRTRWQVSWSSSASSRAQLGLPKYDNDSGRGSTENSWWRCWWKN